MVIEIDIVYSYLLVIDVKENRHSEKGAALVLADWSYRLVVFLIQLKLF